MTAKVPYPRQLATTESLDTLTHWKAHVRNYFRRDENLKEFFARATAWDATRDNYGFVGEDAATKADYLEGLLDPIAGFMPGPYLTVRITKQTTSMQGVFDIIWEHYDVQPTAATFLDLADMTLSKEERYIDLYYRMLYHCDQHLLHRQDQVDGVALPADEVMSHSHKNLVALNWLKAISPHLVTIVRLEKHTELKSGKQLHTLVLDISKNIDDWLKRHGHKSPIRQDSASQPESQV